MPEPEPAKTVWMVVEHFMEGGWVFTTKEKAEAFAKEKEKEIGCNGLEIDEVPLDPSPDDDG